MNDNPPDIVDWAISIVGFYLASTKRPIVLTQHQIDLLRHLFTLDKNGRFRYQNILWSAPKKSGKTTIAALITLWFALFIDPPNEIFICANDLEQSIARVFRDVAMAIRLIPELSNRTIVRAQYFLIMERQSKHCPLITLARLEAGMV